MNLFVMYGILNEILEKGPTHAQEISEKFEISTRSVYRYVDQMSMQGIPIYTQIGRNGGIYLEQKHILNKAVLTTEEVHFLCGILDENKNPIAHQIKEKLNLF